MKIRSLPMFLGLTLASALGSSVTLADDSEEKNKKMQATFATTTVSEQEIITQFHGNPYDADLRLFMAGNQFVVIDLLVDEFQRQNPNIKKIFYATLPPGQLRDWILKGGIHIKGDAFLGKEGFKLTVMPDVYTTVSKSDMDSLFAGGLITRYYTYAHNRIGMLTSASDPLANTSLSAQQFYDLLKDPSVTISEPHIVTQGIARHFWQMYTDISKVLFPTDATVQAMNPTMFDPAGLAGDPHNSLRRIVYHDKAQTAATYINAIHHIETPPRIRAKSSRVGGVWYTEYVYERDRHHATDLAFIELNDVGLDGKPLDRRTKVTYLASITEGVMEKSNADAAKQWIAFLRSPEAQSILRTGGFILPTVEVLKTPFVYPDSATHSRVGEY